MKNILLLLAVIATASLAWAQLSLDLETGVAFSGYNDVRIPNNATQTRFSLTDDLKSQPVMYGRANLHWLVHPRHEVSLLVSPLTTKPSGTLDFPVVFQNETFAAGQKIDAVYRFNSYRLQYLYRFKNQNAIVRALGVSLKVRDAIISLKNEDVYAEKTDLGFVPLIGFELGYDFSDEFGILFKGEGLISPTGEGRAEDVLLAAKYNIDDRYSLFLGYRLLEGGGDVDEVYSFANINYLAVGTQIRF